jgi:MoxR-like ATPase
MQERQVSIGGTTFPLPEPFMVLATQNPIEHEGTYPLPEAQVDRFMFKLVVTYPERQDERDMLDRMTDGTEPAARPVTDLAHVARARDMVRGVYVDGRVKDYVLDLVSAARHPGRAGFAELAPYIEFGPSPRAGVFLLRAAKAHAFLEGRGWVTPEDIKALVPDVLRHRLILTYRADAEQVTPDHLLGTLLDKLPVP